MAGSPSSESKIVYDNASRKLYDQQVKGLYKALDADNIAAAVRIIDDMGDNKNTMAIEPLTVLLEYPDEAIQASSAVALGKIGDMSSITPLVSALSRSSDKVKISIVTSLGMFGDISVIKAIEAIPLTPDEPKLINVVRSTVYKLNHPEGTEENVPIPEDASTGPEVDLIDLREKKIENPNVPPEKEKSPLLAALGSFFVPGLGQVYNGEGYSKGFTYFIGIYVGYILLFIPGFAIWLYSVYNAYTTANKINTGEIRAAEPSVLSVVVYALLVAIVIPIIIGVMLTVLMFALIFPMIGY